MIVFVSLCARYSTNWDSNNFYVVDIFCSLTYDNVELGFIIVHTANYALYIVLNGPNTEHA